MKIISTALGCIIFAASVALARPAREPECEVLKSVKLSFYGRQDVEDPIAYPECGRANAGGRGTYESPLTMASAPGEFAKCEIIYVPYLLKYVRFEDLCLDCVKDFSKGKLHIQIWTGNGMIGGQEQAKCEKDLTPNYAMGAIQLPSKDLLIDTTPLYQWGASDPCRLDRRYTVLNINAFCYNKKEKAVDHMDNQRNSVHAMRLPYEHHEEPAQNEEQQREGGEQEQQQQQQQEAPAPGEATQEQQAQAPGNEDIYYDSLDTEWALMPSDDTQEARIAI